MGFALSPLRSSAAIRTGMAAIPAQLAVSFMAPGVGNGVGGMLWPACQLTGLFMPGTAVSVGNWAGLKVICYNPTFYIFLK